MSFQESPRFSEVENVKARTRGLKPRPLGRGIQPVKGENK